MSKTSRSSVTTLDAWDASYAPEFSNVLRLVEDDTAALRQIRNRGQASGMHAHSQLAKKSGDSPTTNGHE